MLTSIGYFDTRIDTRNIFVPMTIHFKKRNYINKEGFSPVYLHVSSKDRRERISLDIYVDPKKWNTITKRLKGSDTTSIDTNLYLDIIWSKITKIRKQYKLTSKPLTIDSFLFEFKNDMPTTNFVEFFKAILKQRKSTIKQSTHDKEMAIVNKLERFKPIIMFYEINEMFFDNYRHWLADQGNNRATRNGNIKIIKKYLRYAVKAGIKLPVSLDEIKGGSTSGQKSYLNREELKLLYDYFYSNHIPTNHKICLGYFLFSCFTGLRSSDVLNQKRQELLKGSFTFTHVKTGKNQFTKLNNEAKEIINSCSDLFVKKYSPSHIRNTVKDICKFFQINKRVDYHMSRHTFGTNYILLGGSVTTLQILMNHSVIAETMTYVHMADLEKNAEADLMDTMFN